ncbi:DinB family protein [Armatimonas sp.]|uniref:DinB family protein n=1 Tax=Armatimonas sp. TaxID=1872638 RepID=UPI00286B252A|nr:DinB family protein [Armatimonas sp.]
MLDTYLSQLELAYFEVTEAFSGLADENVWKRPAEGILSIGELAGHIAYAEANRFAGEGPLSSPLIDPRFWYYPVTVVTPPSEEQLAMTAPQVGAELARVHHEAVAHLKARNLDLEASAPDGSPGNTYGEVLQYMVFHVGYHIGQMYTVRHLLGEVTPDN